MLIITKEQVMNNESIDKCEEPYIDQVKSCLQRDESFGVKCAAIM